MYRVSMVLTAMIVLSQGTPIQDNDYGVASRIEPSLAQAFGGYAAEQLKLVDERNYLHCHNLPGRMYCHKGGRLPRNWPPNTNTPGTSSLRKFRAHTAASRAGLGRDCWFCWP